MSSNYNSLKYKKYTIVIGVNWEFHKILYKTITEIKTLLIKDMFYDLQL